MVELKFTNSDATPKVARLQVHRDDVALVMQWYGAFYAGDRYTVHADGHVLRKDQNGELVA